MLESGAWLKNAAHANRCAALLERRVKDIPGVTLKFPREANALFLELPGDLAEKLKALGWKFYSFIGAGGARFLCSWETTEAEIDSLAADISSLAKFAG